jgi:hypothetical protein
MGLSLEPFTYLGPRLSHPEPFSMADPQHLLTGRAEVDVSVAELRCQLTEPHGVQFLRTVWADRSDVRFLDC